MREGGAAVKYIRIFADEVGETHIEDVTMPYRTDVVAENVPPLHISSLLKGEGVFFMGTEVNQAFRDLPFHNAPRRMMVIQFAGSSEQTTSDGSVRLLNPGDVLIAEDVTGKGHRSRNIGSEVLYAMIPLT